MKPLIALIAVLAWGAARAQSLIPSHESGKRAWFLNSGAAVLNPPEPNDHITCSVDPIKPELRLDFMFYTGYQASIPRKELTGPGNRLTMVLRVRSERREDQPVIFVQEFLVPAIGEDVSGNAFIDGMFRVGQGKYHVDFLMRDIHGRTCTRVWDVEAKVNGKDVALAQGLAKDLIKPVESTTFHEDAPVEHQQIGRPLHVKVIINFAPQNLGAAALGSDDLEGLVAILRKISREPRIGSFSIVACSVPARQMLYRQRHAPRIDIPALGEALKPLNLASMDVKQLALKNGETEFLERLITEETRGDHADGLIFVGPKYPLETNVSREIIEHMRGLDHPVFYLSYGLDSSYYPWRDAIGHVVKELHGFEYDISRPRDLFNAWSDIVSRMLSGTASTGGNNGGR